jgi:hypothetical protein
MQNRISINTDIYLQLLLMVPAICLLGFTGCSSIDARAEKGFYAAFIEKADPQSNAGQGQYAGGSLRQILGLFGP